MFMDNYNAYYDSSHYLSSGKQLLNALKNTIGFTLIYRDSVTFTFGERVADGSLTHNQKDVIWTESNRLSVNLVYIVVEQDLCSIWAIQVPISR